jgi:hypothetical protein
MGLEDLPKGHDARIVTINAIDYMHFYDLKREDFDLVGISCVKGYDEANVRVSLIKNWRDNRYYDDVVAFADVVIQPGNFEMIHATAIKKREKKKDDGVVKIGPEK